MVSGIFAALLVACPPEPAAAQQAGGAPGSPSATTTNAQRRAASARSAKIRGQDRAQRRAIEALLAGARRPAERRAQHSTHHDRRHGFWRAVHLWRRRPDAQSRQDRQGRSSLHQFPFDGAVLADPRGAHYGPQSSFGRLRRRRRAGDRLSRLRLDHHPRQGHHRAHTEGQRLSHVVVRQGPQHAGIPGESGRALRSMADRHGLRVFLRLHRRRHQPVAAKSVPQHDARFTPMSAIRSGI